MSESRRGFISWATGITTDRGWTVICLGQSQIAGATDESNVAKGLWEVAPSLACRRIDLLSEQAEWTRILQSRLKDLLRLLILSAVTI